MEPRLFGLAAALLTIATSMVAANAGEVLDRVLEKGVLVDAVEGEFPPFNYMGENNEIVGFDIDIAKEFAKRLGVKLEVITVGWDVITAGHWADRWDITIEPMAKTKARQEVLDFPASYYFAPGVILVHKDNNSIQKTRDLSGKRVGAQTGSTNELYLQKRLEFDTPIDFDFEDPKIVSYETEPMGIDDLMLGDGVRLDAMVIGLLTAQTLLEQGKPVKVVGDPLFYEEGGVAIDKGDPEFAARITEIFDAMRADGTLRRLSENVFGVDITAKPEAK